MSAIPPNSIASVLQSDAAKSVQSKADDAERNERARVSRAAAGRADAVLEVEATDDDTQIHSDAEGAGGSGRETREPPSDEVEVADEQDSDAVTIDEDGTPHLDLTV